MPVFVHTAQSRELTKQGVAYQIENQLLHSRENQGKKKKFKTFNLEYKRERNEECKNDEVLNIQTCK